ncbi:hypothetical protein [Palleronia sp. LCG004]|uniref:hypothetical protein n=1 Tax=Palleronia sp. LCG004 TaxID=3079304 RepID=UPI0029438838|nr:hypothetical protein [Palleronia sp. LCG004]WOI57183.1 hypothetical protein RVY76_05175 [Palleronia sp. LCG004]
MTQAIGLTVFLLATLGLAQAQIGHPLTYRVASGAIIGMSIVIATTFLWLWRVRLTPLALGMAFSWAGGALVMVWWWKIADKTGTPTALDAAALLLAVATYTTGAILHFAVITRSFDLPRATPIVLPVVAYILSATVACIG